LKQLIQILVFVTILYSPYLYGQRVGLVLSGGGAAGFAHIGVMKALEENNIPINYITGSSSGALVGALYAAGYSPQEIEKYVLSKRFKIIVQGEIEIRNQFLFQKEENEANLLKLTFSTDSIYQRFLPTKFRNSRYLDYEMLTILGTASESVNGDFNKLFVPFQCVASNITTKKSVLLSNGKLNQAVRASMTFPFFIHPIKINDQLLFDGGLYNNFPSDIMINSFNPDIIIGSNVSSNALPPDEHDVISQVVNMMVTPTNFTLPKEKGIIIAPNTGLTTFDFEKIEEAIQAGYNSTLLKIDSIKLLINKKENFNELSDKREKFRKKITPLKITNINTTNTNLKNSSFIQKSILPEKVVLDSSQFGEKYFKLTENEAIEFIFPTLNKNKDSSYTLNLQTRKAKEIGIEVGGLFSSRPINTGYIGMSYQYLNRRYYKIKAESYFGKFYGSAKINGSIQFSGKLPISLNAYYTLNRWDYFKSLASFFEDVKPSFLVQTEQYAGAGIKIPVTNNTVNIIDFRIFETKDDYYQTDKFTTKDTADFTKFNGYSLKWKIEHNTLNRKQFANSGKLFSLNVRYISGIEDSESGSTSIEKYIVIRRHNWINIQTDNQIFPISNRTFHLGFHLKATYSTQGLFSNYTASILSMQDFSPLVDCYTLFLPEYRSSQHVGIGGNFIYSPFKNIDLRTDIYLYQAFRKLNKTNDISLYYEKANLFTEYILSTSIIYNSVIGPVRLTANYFPKQTNPVNLQLTYGYVLFNERAIK
jgi:NTE family protein